MRQISSLGNDVQALRHSVARVAEQQAAMTCIPFAHLPMQTGTISPIACPTEHTPACAERDTVTAPTVEDRRLTLSRAPHRMVHPVTLQQVGSATVPEPDPSHISPHRPAGRSTNPNCHHLLTLDIDDERFSYDALRVPDPPMQHFSKNVESLFEHWNISNILRIGSQGIPIKHWRTVYKDLKRVGVKPRAWDAIKVEWGNWKVSNYLL